MKNEKPEIQTAGMRLDKYLKVSRIIKRRTVARDACDSSRILVNGKPEKASYNVKLGDEIQVNFGGSKNIKYIVKSLKECIRKEDCSSMYEIVADKPKDNPPFDIADSIDISESEV